MRNEEIYLLKIGELMLMRGFVSSAMESLIAGSRPAGKSAHQELVRSCDIQELDRRINDLLKVEWPKARTE